MKAKFSRGQTVQLSEAGRANENYEDRPLIITGIFDHYTTVNSNDPTGHPGFDSGVGGPLYEFEGYPHALYEFEIEAA